jgi:DNA mismatch repair protein MutL
VGSGVGSDAGFDLTAAPLRPVEQRFPFEPGAAFGTAVAPAQDSAAAWAGNLAAPNSDAPATLPRPDQIMDLKPLGQVSSSFIVAVNGEGLWIVDQHVAHERVLFEQHLEARHAGKVESQRMLMPMVIELSPRQLVIYEKIAEELAANGFEVEVNMPLDQTKMEWLLEALAKTDCPMSCPHGRPVVLRYSLKEIEKAFHRI